MLWGSTMKELVLGLPSSRGISPGIQMGELSFVVVVVVGIIVIKGEGNL